MRGRIACSADRLILLEPAMIQSVVDSHAFHIGMQYSSENRVRITEANEVHLASAVMGKSGLYEQSIQLREGFLEARCTCTLSEQPLCRHGVAALLEYHRWSKPRPAPRAPDPKPSPAQADQVSVTDRSADVKFSDLTVFIEWMQQAVKAIAQRGALPDQPTGASGEVASWIRIIRNLDDRRREGEDLHLNLQAGLQHRETALARLTQQLEASLEDSKTLQTACRDLRREIASQKSQLAKTGQLSKQFDQLEADVKAIAGDLAEKSTKLASLTETIKQAAVALRAMDMGDSPG